MGKRILVVRLGSLGDIILTSATVLNLKIGFPDSVLTYLTRNRYADIVRRFDHVDHVVAISDRPSTIDYLRCLHRLDNDNFDILVDLHGNMRSWLARKIVTSTQTVVYPKRRVQRQRIVRSRQIPESWPHTIDLYNDCVRQLGARVICKRPLMRSERQSIPDNQPEGHNRAMVVIAPGAAHPTKQWDLQKFNEVALWLRKSIDAKVHWVVTQEDADHLSSLQDTSPSDSVMSIDQPIDELSSLFAAADLTIANDSGLTHLSSAVGTPVIALFGPTHPSLGFAPRGLFDSVIEIDEYCRPCSLHGKKPCHREERFCFSKIPVETVTEAVRGILERSRSWSKALFVDRDGTIIKDKHYLSDPDQVELEPGSAEALRLASQHGLKIVIVSNQSGVARGFHDIDTVEKVNARVLELLSVEGATADAVYFCPHHNTKSIKPEYTIDCYCRKPAAGMAEEAAQALGIDLRRSVVIGDTAADYNLGRVIGGGSYLVRTGYGVSVEQRLRNQGIMNDNTVFDNLLSAVRHVIGEMPYA